MRAAITAVVAAALLAAGCSLLVGTTDPIQCRANDDCEASAALRGRVCESGICVVPRAPIEPVSVDAGDGCVSTQLCTQANSNRPSVCKTAGGACIPWATDDCPIVRGDWESPDVFVVGMLAPTSYLQADKTEVPVDYAVRVLRAVELAHEELTDAVPGGLLVGGRRRPVALVACNTKADEATTKATYEHLVEVIGAKALVVVSDRDLAAVAAQPSAKDLAIACTDCLVPLPAELVAWRHMPLIAQEAPLAAWRVADLETRIKSGPNPPADLRVAILTEDASPARAFTTALLTTLTFNGKAAALNAPQHLLALQTDDPKDGIIHASYAAQIAQFAPHVIVASVGPDFGTHYMELIEKGWPDGVPRPSYVLTDLNYEIGPYVKPIGTDDDLRRRISGVHPRVTPELRRNLAEYTVRYLQRFKQAPDSNHSGYEAMASLALSMSAASAQGALDGPAISSQFPNLVGGATVIDYGRGNMETSLTLLRERGRVDVRGLWTTLDWAAGTRELTADTGMFCFGREGTDLVLRDDAEVFYSAETKQVTGSYACE